MSRTLSSVGRGGRQGTTGLAACMAVLLALGLSTGVGRATKVSAAGGHPVTHGSAATVSDLDSRAITPARGIYWGANIGPQLTGRPAPWDPATITRFESTVHKKLSIVAMGWPFATCNHGNCTPFAFPAVGLTNVRRAGAIPLVSFETAPVSGIADDPITLQGIIAGHWDSYLRGYAREVKAYGHPFFLRLDWEMNGNWFPWSPGVNGNTPADYVEAWRHIHNIFTSAGATNATWVWCPNVEYYTNLRALYPGSKYVDWTCLDGYNNGTIPGQPNDTFQTWDQLYRTSYNEITTSIARGKPMMIGEFASSSFGGDKAAWISNALADVPENYPDIRALVYYDRSAEIGSADVNWTIDSSPSVLRAFTAGIHNSAYVTNRYGHLSGGVIAPPTG